MEMTGGTSRAVSPEPYLVGCRAADRGRGGRLPEAEIYSWTSRVTAGTVLCFSDPHGAWQ